MGYCFVKSSVIQECTIEQVIVVYLLALKSLLASGRLTVNGFRQIRRNPCRAGTPEACDPHRYRGWVSWDIWLCHWFPHRCTLNQTSNGNLRGEDLVHEITPSTIVNHTGGPVCTSNFFSTNTAVIQGYGPRRYSRNPDGSEWLCFEQSYLRR